MDHSQSDPSETPQSHNQITLVQLSSIALADDLNGRLERDHEHVRTLANDIASNGLTNPVTLRVSGAGYELIAGRNRVAAYALLRRKHIPAIIREVDDLAAATIRLTENLTRSNLSPVEESIQLSSLVNQHPQGVDGVAVALGRRPEWILDRLEMTDWPEDLLAHVHTKKLKLGVAALFAKIDDVEHRSYLTDQAINHGITVATARYWYQEWKANKESAAFLSQNRDKEAPKITLMHISVVCRTCLKETELVTSMSLRVCSECYKRIEDLSRDNSNASTLPDYDQPGLNSTPQNPQR